MDPDMVYLEDAKEIKADAQELKRSIQEARESFKKIKDGLQYPDGRNRIEFGSVVSVILMSYLRYTLYDIPADDMIKLLQKEVGWKERDIRYVLETLGLE